MERSKAVHTVTLIKADEMKLGDVVRAEDSHGDYVACTVIQIEGGEVTLFRPYVRVSDFIYTGGVIPYIGTETFKIRDDAWHNYVLLSRVFETLK